MTKLYDRSFGLVVVSQVFFGFANTVMAHYARWIEFLGGGLDDIGWVMGVSPVASLFLRPWLGQWIVQLGARVLWGGGLVCFAAGTLTNFLVDGVGWPLYALRALVFLGGAVVYSSTITYVSQTAPRDRQAEAIGIMGVGGFFGILTGPYVGDLILAGRTQERFVLLFAIATVALVVPFLVLFFLRPVPSAGARSDPRHSSQLLSFVQSVHRYWPGSVLLVLVAVGLWLAVPFGFLASFVDDLGIARDVAEGERAPLVGWFFVAYAGCGVTLRIVSRRVPDRIGPRRVLLAGLLTMGLGMFSFMLVDSERPWLIIVSGLICGAGHSLTFNTMLSVVLNPFPVEERGIGSALALMMLDVGLIGGAPVLGVLANAVGYYTMFAAVGCVCMLTVVLFGLACIVERRKRRSGLDSMSPLAEVGR